MSSYQVIEPGTPLFAAPRSDIPIETELLFGETVTALEEEREGWLKVRNDYDGYEGYVDILALSREIDTPTHYVAWPEAIVLAERAVQSRRVARLEMNSRVTVLEQRDQFLRLKDLGWVHQRAVREIGDWQIDFVEVALLHLDHHYGWAGLDCSRLNQRALRACGHEHCPRNSSEQREVLGESLPKDSPLRRGDLVFWKGHTGIMLDEETLLHATDHHMLVVEEPLAVVVERFRRLEGKEVLASKRLSDYLVL